MASNRLGHAQSSLCLLFPEHPSTVWQTPKQLQRDQKYVSARLPVCLREGWGTSVKESRKRTTYLVLLMSMWLWLFSFYSSLTFLKSSLLIIDRHFLGILVSNVCPKTFVQRAWLYYSPWFQEAKEHPSLHPGSAHWCPWLRRSGFWGGNQFQAAKEAVNHSMPWHSDVFCFLRFLYLAWLQGIEVNDTEEIWRLHSEFSLVVL